MKNNFSPSINIVRDQFTNFNYIPTPNSERIIAQINNSVLKGIRSFYIVGSFGTGKSSFLLALQTQLSNGKRIFNTPITFNGKNKYQIINIVGDYRSLEDSFREQFGLKSNKDVLKSLDDHYKKALNKNKGLFIVIDEFGKFLEYAANNNPEKELYLIQKIAEYSNDQSKNVILITSLHQGFDIYKAKLNEKTRNEWDKIKGRLKEIAFNEPVEQLLYLAARCINGKPPRNIDNEFKSLFNAIKKSRVYPLSNAIDTNLAKKLYPIDLLAAGVLTNSLQRYGQNERSLFTFLETNDIKRLNTSNNKYFNLDSVYDYLIDNYYSLLSSKYNPDYFKWSILRNSIDRCLNIFGNKAQGNVKLIKTIGLMNIFAPTGARINKSFLDKYGKYSLGIKNVNSVIELLESKKIIRYRDYSESYTLFEGTDLDIDISLKEAEHYINPNPPIVDRLNEYFEFPYIPAKASYIKRGTPRFFEFVISEQPILSKPTGEVDGIVNLVFIAKNEVNKVNDTSKSNKEAIVYGVYRNKEKVVSTIKEIDKINYVLEKNIDDRVAQRELKNLKDSMILELNQLVLENLYKNESDVIWLFKGDYQNVKSQSDFNKLLSSVIDSVYKKTPIFHNELINREKLPGSITIARRSLIEKMIENSDITDLGMDSNSFPPEKTIYLSLLKSTGIHRFVNGEFKLSEPTDKSFESLWRACEKFFESSKKSKKSLVDLVDVLQNKPFKLKKGFLDHWIPIYLIMKKDDYALYDEKSYIPYFNVDLFDLIIRYPQNYYIKAFDISGVKIDLFNRYRRLINKTEEGKISNKSFIDTIKPFLTFYRGLPEYSKFTKRMSNEALAVREAIAKSKDPEETFFEDFPNALGYSTVKLYKSNKYLEKYTNDLKNCIREIRTSYDELLNRIEEFIEQELNINSTEFPDNKRQINERYKGIKEYLLLPYQKAFYQRINSEIDDRKSWLSSIIQPIIGKNLENINDTDEEVIYEKLSSIFKELDNLCEFAKLKVDQVKEYAIKIEITPTNDAPVRKIVRVSINKSKNIKTLENTIRTKLSKNKSNNQVVLLGLLKEQMENE